MLQHCAGIGHGTALSDTYCHQSRSITRCYISSFASFRSHITCRLNIVALNVSKASLMRQSHPHVAYLFYLPSSIDLTAQHHDGGVPRFTWTFNTPEVHRCTWSRAGLSLQNRDCPKNGSLSNSNLTSWQWPQAPEEPRGNIPDHDHEGIMVYARKHITSDPQI